MLIVGHYSDIDSIDDDDHYSDIQDIIPRRASVRSRLSHDHYIDIDRINADSGSEDQPTADPGGGEHAARSQGHDGLDPSVLATLLQPQRHRDHAGFAVASRQQTAEETEMTGIASGRQNTVSRHYCSVRAYMNCIEYRPACKAST